MNADDADPGKLPEMPKLPKIAEIAKAKHFETRRKKSHDGGTPKAF